MTRPVAWETFDAPGTEDRASADAGSDEARERARLQGYDEGYKSGWDDAMRKARDDGELLSAEFSRNLRDLGFTYEEARAHVMRSLEEFLRELCATFLPGLMHETFGPIVLETLADIAGEAAGAPVLIRVAPGDAERLRVLVDLDTAVPAQIVDEPTLAEGQAYLKLGAEERMVDLNEPLERVKSSLGAIAAATERTLHARKSA